MKSVQFLVAALLLVASPVVLADKPDPGVPNPPVQVLEYNVDADGYIAVHEQGIADVRVTNTVETEFATEAIDVNVVSLPSHYQFIGFSSVKEDGAEGVFTFTKLCQDDFGPTSRMCNTVEVMETKDIPNNIGYTDIGWVRPVVVGDGTFDASGANNGGHVSAYFPSLSCNGWSFHTFQGDPYVGMTVDGRGRFNIETCSVARAVACCAPVTLAPPPPPPTE